MEPTPFLSWFENRYPFRTACLSECESHWSCIHTSYAETTNVTGNNKRSWNQQAGIGSQYLSGNNLPQIKLIRQMFTLHDYLLISVAFAVVCRVGCFWVTGVVLSTYTYLRSISVIVTSEERKQSITASSLISEQMFLLMLKIYSG